MSWSPELYIGEFRPWPDTVHVVRGKTDETRRYVPEDFSAMSRENVELRKLVQELYESAWLEYPSAFETVFLGRIRELGIEVNP